MTLKIVPMEKRHLAALAEIERACFRTPWGVEALGEQLENGNNVFLVAEYQDAPVGYVGCQTVLDEGYITNVAVQPNARRQGVARQLLAALECQAKARDLSFITLEVRESNAPAIALYEAAGYAAAGKRKGFYSQPREDALLMTLTFHE